jgi:hypothetical protein
MSTQQAQLDQVQATEPTAPAKSKGALLIAIGAFLLLVVLILTNMK